MNHLRPNAFWLVSCALLFSSHSAVADTQRACPPLEMEELKKRLEAKKELHLVFFSTWCSDCVAHLKKVSLAAADGATLAIAVFDSPSKVEKTLSRLEFKFQCLFDEVGLSKKLGVKVVPFEKNITKEDLNGI